MGFFSSLFGKKSSEAVVISCYYNPENSPYRLENFKKYYENISHLDHRIIECGINGKPPELKSIVKSENYEFVKSDSLLWHKEALLNKVVRELPENYKYVFWVDADILFKNENWFFDGIKKLKKGANVVQLFSECYHLDKDETEPTGANQAYRTWWRGFAYNYVENKILHRSENYDTHGHVGFAWGARREVLEEVPLFDKALIGGADHIIAHACACQIDHSCITKAYVENAKEVHDYSVKLCSVVQGRLDYVDGVIYHLWHGDIRNRQYLKRIQEFNKETTQIHQKDKNGLYVAPPNPEIKKYYEKREDTKTVYVNTPASKVTNIHYHAVTQQNNNGSFLASMIIADATDSTLLGYAAGGNLPGALVGGMLHNHSHSNDCSHNHSEQPAGAAATMAQVAIDSGNFS